MLMLNLASSGHETRCVLSLPKKKLKCLSHTRIWVILYYFFFQPSDIELVCKLCLLVRSSCHSFFSLAPFALSAKSDLVSNIENDSPLFLSTSGKSDCFPKLCRDYPVLYIKYFYASYVALVWKSQKNTSSNSCRRRNKSRISWLNYLSEFGSILGSRGC